MDRFPELDVNTADADGSTALHYAALCGNQQAYTTLLKYGARADVQDHDGQTPADLSSI
jgi:ankyrin repeat protein